MYNGNINDCKIRSQKDSVKAELAVILRCSLTFWNFKNTKKALKKSETSFLYPLIPRKITVIAITFPSILKLTYQ